VGPTVVKLQLDISDHAQLVEQAGFPKGVVNIITTKSSSTVGRVLCTHPIVKKISFTGVSLCDEGEGIRG
jgi:acyl-CoA reductase-like NAD-dependent aldehyde dehydrogenase